MNTLITYFLQRPIIANAIFVAIIILGIFSWPRIGKEEMPEFAMDWISVSVNYPGATAKEVEEFIIRPIEDEIKGVQGIYEINSNASPSTASISVNIDSKKFSQKEVVQEFKDAVLRVQLPQGVRNLPRFRQFNSSEKAIIDIGVYFRNKNLLENEDREILQDKVLLLESKLLNSKHISSISRKGFFSPELLITPDKEKLNAKDITTYDIIQSVKEQHIDRPIGTLREDIEKKFSIYNSLNSAEKIKQVPVRANFSGNVLSLKEVAEVKKQFIDNPSIFKINGRQGIVINVKKNPASDILTARESVLNEIKKVKHVFESNDLDIVLMDDESSDVRNRLSLILSNGATGFALIVLVLFFALNLKTAFWVSMGIPFSLAFTLIIAYISGQTVNNMTLAGIIIVLGIVVDDAIIIADNIKEKYEQGLRGIEALKTGVLEVVSPIAASIVTTILAFIPLMFFDGYFGLFIKYIPVIVCFMLLGSLLESYFILPGHLKVSPKNENKIRRKDFFVRLENIYQRKVTPLIKHSSVTLIISLFILTFTVLFFANNSKFMMFPREDVKEIFIKVKTPQDSDRLQTSKYIQELENFMMHHPDTVAVRSTIANSRRGREVKQNQAWIRVEVKNKLERTEDVSQTIKNWETFIESLKEKGNFTEARVFKSWFGHGSGSPIEIMVRAENEKLRLLAGKMIQKELEAITEIQNTDLEEPLQKKEYQVSINQTAAKKLGVSPLAIESTLRAATFSERLYSLRDEYQEFDTRIKINLYSINPLEDLKELKVPGKNGNTISLSKLISISETEQANSVYRFDYKRTTRVFADFKPETKMTPLELGDILESKILPKVNTVYPEVTFLLKGDIEQSRKGISDFKWSIYTVIFGILVILIIGFNNLSSPMIVMTIIPFGLGSACLTLLLHGVKVYGFFSVIGAIGMIGVIVNDAIVMIDKLNSESPDNIHDILKVSSSRIRAILMTTVTTVIGILPTAYGLFGHDSMLSEMMLVMGWGLLFSTLITLIIVPVTYKLLNIKKIIN